MCCYVYGPLYGGLEPSFTDLHQPSSERNEHAQWSWRGCALWINVKYKNVEIYNIFHCALTFLSVFSYYSMLLVFEFLLWAELLNFVFKHMLPISRNVSALLFFIIYFHIPVNFEFRVNEKRFYT